MAALLRRTSSVAQSSINLYCAQCDAQIGIFENEWIRLTSSYARSKEKGTHFGTEVGQRTQMVPSGPAQRSAEGCVMAEVFCRKCSNMVGQYCKSAPDPEKQALVDQYFYKFSRTFLKDSRTNTRVDPVFGYGSDIVKPHAARSSVLPRSSMTPASRWANTPLRQASSTPAMSAQSVTRGLSRQDSQTSSPSADTAEFLWDQSREEIQKVRQDLAAQDSLFQEQSEKLALQATRLDDHDASLKEQDARIVEQESCLDAQATRIVEQDALIQNQSQRLQVQQMQLAAITGQLTKLQKSMDDLKNLLLASRQGSTLQLALTPGCEASNSDFEAMLQNLRAIHRDAQEIRTLRDENKAMKSRLTTIANAMGAPTDILGLENSDPNSTLSANAQTSQVLGKRKRKAVSTVSTSRPDNSTAEKEGAVVRFHGRPEQMPTPQSSNGGLNSPVQTPSVTESVEGANQEPVLQQEAVEGSKPVRERKGTSLSTSKPRGRGRPPKIRESMDVQVSADRPAPVETSKTPQRPKTRASTRAVQDDEHDTEDLVVSHEDLTEPTTQEPSAPESEQPSSPKRNEASLQAQLPTVEVASSILGMNLDALIASSQALRFGLAQSKPANLSRTGQQSSEAVPAVADKQSDSCVLRAGSHGADQELSASHDRKTADLNPQTFRYSQFTFIQDPGIYEHIDFSDDDDDLVATDADLYGEDSLVAADSTTPMGPDSPHRAADTSEPVVSRDNRSMAPEPMRRKRPPVVRKKVVNLDRIHIATPEIFERHIRAGRALKLVRPKVTNARVRDLNEELTRLGLTEWIGRKKNSKEYRDAVAAARARFRNANKAAYLSSRGLNPNLADPSASLPEVLTGREDSTDDQMPLFDVQNAPGPTGSIDLSLIDPALLEDPGNVGNAAPAAEDQIPATRARVRRSSASLLSGLQGTEGQLTSSEVKRGPQKRKSDGRRKSQRRSNVTTVDAEANTEAARTENVEVSAENLAPNDAGGVEVEVEKIQAPAPNKHKSASKSHETFVRSTAPNVSLDPVNILNEAFAIDFSDDDEGQIPGQTTREVLVNVPPREEGGGMHSIHDAKSQAQQREEAILLRDRMAKELMEQDDMEF